MRRRVPSVRRRRQHLHGTLSGRRQGPLWPKANPRQAIRQPGAVKRSLLPLRLHACSPTPLRSCSPNTVRLAQPRIWPPNQATIENPAAGEHERPDPEDGNAHAEEIKPRFRLASPSDTNRHRRQAAATPAKHASIRTRCRCIRFVACSFITGAQASRLDHAPCIAPRRVDERALQTRPSRPRYANTHTTSRTRTRIAAPVQRGFIHLPAIPAPQKRIPARFRVRGSSDTATAAGPRAGACRAALMQPRPSASSAHVPSRARWPALPGTNALRP